MLSKLCWFCFSVKFCFAFYVAIRGCQLEQAASEVREKFSHEAMGLSEQLGDLYCKVGCYNKALEAYQTQVRINILTNH